MISEETYYVVDSLGVAHPETIERARVTLPQLFVEGGLHWMIGIGALIFAIFGTLMGILQILNVVQMFGDVSPAVLCGGLKVTLIPTFYGFIVYFISLIIRVIQKPRI